MFLLFLGFIHSESEVRYFGEDVPGVSQVAVNTFISKFLFHNFTFRVFPKTKLSVIKMMKAQ